MVESKHPKRPRDPNQLAKLMVDLAAKDETDPVAAEVDKKASDAGRKGAAARASVLSPKKRSEIAKAAAKARWEKDGS